MDGNFIKFLGTAGARYVVARQMRSSGGILICLGGRKILIDPGPGSLVRCALSRPPIDASKLDGLVLTHSHIDHSNDVNIMIDAMTFGGIEKRGVLFAPGECIQGANPVLFNYLRQCIGDIVLLEPERQYSLGEITFSTSIRHRHPVETYGLLFRHNGLTISFLADTKYFEELKECYRGSDILVLNVVRDTPFEDDTIMHLSFEDARELVGALKPRKAILTHFGKRMLAAKPALLAKALARETGVEVYAAYDGMRFPL
ncbi:MAG: MBL fold metallo-hydrolase [Candidatus Eremiobacteraeota bacterium]|nr:MBL fold metallo-hydrolase [Candidatus Eremiobacteraeota bacterium]